MLPIITKLALIGPSHSGGQELAKMVSAMWQNSLPDDTFKTKGHVYPINCDYPLNYCSQAYMQNEDDISFEHAIRVCVNNMNPHYQVTFLKKEFEKLSLETTVNNTREQVFFIVFNLYQSSAVDYLKTNGFKIMFINCPEKDREQRLTQRYKTISTIDADDFLIDYDSVNITASPSIEVVTITSPSTLQSKAGLIISKMGASDNVQP